MNQWIHDPIGHAEAQERLWDSVPSLEAPAEPGRLYRVCRPDHTYYGWQGVLVGFNSGFAWLRVGTVLQGFREEDVEPV